MPTITFIDAQGAARSVQAECGQSLMTAARANDVPGIDADCGGMCACATCHVYVDTEFLSQLPAPGDGEEALLEFVDKAQPNSRLACQICVTEVLKGMIVRTPSSQR
ncbi:2Fe-2S iron-sulfur cluster-binding protein [Alteraurantiacibacter buctensis]|uniref:2Fe-2S iron-sulfur cluster binding domain-containing protein n=1 Tax=Alteraurantiacibacter buctensis TaxID=1503981 RepID=A0A844YXE3_9SPHN|nr:2Fe-2S iron-sulfur cluster binding domain-containing protein [Alteraurantiacibacter buctensis]